MKKYFGNYLGLVVDDRDPQNRGRTKVFIPHIMPALYESWNEEGKDIKFNITDGGLPTGLDPKIVDRLQKILPWAECAAPIFGAGPAGKYNYSTGTLDAVVQNVGNGNFEKQGAGAETMPPGSLPSADSPESQARAATAVKDGLLYQSSQSLCARGANNILSHYVNGTGMATSGANARDMGPVLESRYSMSTVQDTGVYQNGDTKILTGPGGAQHMETYMNGRWYSDFPQNSSLEGQGSYTNVTLYRLPTSTIDLANSNKPGENPSIDPPQADINMVQPDEQSGSVQDSGTTQIVGYDEAGNPLEENLPGNTGTASKLEASNGVKALLAAIGKGESNFSSGYLANNKNTYNQVSNNINVRNEYNKNGRNLAAAQAAYGDYGFYQNNDANEGATVYNYLVKQGFSQEQATYYRQAITNSQGNGSFSLTDQSQAMVYLLNAQYPNIVSQLNSLDINDPNFASQVAQITKPLQGKWFGLDEGLAAGAANPDSEQFAAINDGVITQIAGAAARPTVQHTTPVASVGGPNTNYMPTGMFGSARAGQTVWVFFQEGNPLFPVYFAASYGANEWANVNQASSPDPIKNIEDPVQGVNTNLSLDGGGIASKQIISGQPSGFEKDEFAFQVYGKNGSALTFTFLATLLNSKYDFRQHTQGDAHYITGGNREDRTTGDHNIVCEQDLIITVGNWSQEALDAANEIQSVINEAMAAAKNTYEGGGGGGTSGSASQLAYDRDARNTTNVIQDENAFRIDTGTLPTTPQGSQGTLGSSDLNNRPSTGVSSMSINNTQSNVQQARTGNAFAINPATTESVFTIKQ